LVVAVLHLPKSNATKLPLPLPFHQSSGYNHRVGPPHRLDAEALAMSHRLLAFLLLLPGLLLTTTLRAADPPAGPFPDKKLEAAVRSALRDPKGALTDEMLHNLFVLEAPGKEITDLTGLEKCKNLSLIKLSKNQIADIAPLKELTNLQSLDLAGNKITDAAPLAGLTKLQYVELSDNQITKLDPFGGLVNLSALYLSGNKVSDLAPLGTLTKLSSLAVAKNQVADLSPLAKITRLSVLDLNDNAVVDLTPLGKQTELKILMIERNKVTDLAALVDWLKADNAGEKRVAPYLRLFLAGNPLADAAKGQTAALQELGVKVKN
jgi:hypothetical protein